MALQANISDAGFRCLFYQLFFVWIFHIFVVAEKNWCPNGGTFCRSGHDLSATRDCFWGIWPWLKTNDCCFNSDYFLTSR